MDDTAPGTARGTHDLVWVEGADAISFLDSQVSQDVGGMPVGAVARSFLLEPRGKLRAILWVLRGEGRVGLLTPAGTGESVVADLARFRFRVDAAFRIDERPVASGWGGGDGDAGWTDDGGVLSARLPGSAPAVVVAGGLPAGSELDGDAVARRRVLAREPWFGVDVDEGTIPQETGLVPEAVSFTKGCYLGQELVARLDSRGHVNRSLRRVVFTAPGPATGDEVTRDGEVVGSLGTVAPDGPGVIALAMLRREVGEGDTVVAAGVAGAVQDPHGAAR